MDTRTLHKRFALAGLPLEVLDRPFVARATESQRSIVQIDVARPDRTARHERFRLYPGAADNRIEVEQVDRSLRQLVLFVHEPARTFEVWVWQGSRRHLGPPPNIVRTEKTGWYVAQKTPAARRHFLAGMDEQHLFIARLPSGTSSVWGAHRALQGEAVRSAERGAWERTIRQGEWFFIALLPRELAEVERETGRSLSPVRRTVGIAEAAGIVRNGRPHVADEVAIVSGRVYVRGSVRHPDHATVDLRRWRRVMANAEPVESLPGIGFVD